MRYRYYAISFTIHLLIVSLLFVQPKPTSERQKEPPKYEKVLEVDVVEIPEEKPEIEQIHFDEDEGFKMKPQEPQKVDCKSSYEGIGISSDTSLGNGYQRITNVYAGYPAANYGLKIGDQIKTSTGEPIRGEAGTTLVLEVMRNGSYFTLEVVRGKVCYEDI